MIFQIILKDKWMTVRHNSGTFSATGKNQFFFSFFSSSFSSELWTKVSLTSMFLPTLCLKEIGFSIKQSQNSLNLYALSDYKVTFSGICYSTPHFQVSKSMLVSCEGFNTSPKTFWLHQQQFMISQFLRQEICN